MKNILDIVSMFLKVAVAALGGLTAADTAILHIDVATFGSIVGGLGVAQMIVKKLQIKVEPPRINQ